MFAMEGDKIERERSLRRMVRTFQDYENVNVTISASITTAERTTYKAHNEILPKVDAGQTNGRDINPSHGPR
jgi:hypothetical protein